VHLALTDDAVVDAILAAVIPGLRPGTIVRTIRRPRPRRHARVDHMAQSGVRFLHAPVFMSPQMCREERASSWFPAR
jgi:hypothetical protein